MELPSPSEEQREIIESFKQGYNVRVEAVAGSGKSTTLLHLVKVCQEIFGVKALMLTYNRILKDEVSMKLKAIQLDQTCNIYTFHGYASKIYHHGIKTDTILHENLRNPPHHDFSKEPGIILIDEVQDMNEDYYKVTSYLMRHGNLVVIVGDRKQCINQYLGATTEYLVNYKQYFDTGRPWKELNLRTSYRLTPATAKFINRNVLIDSNQDLIIGGNNQNKNKKPIYVYGQWNLTGIVLNLVRKYGPNELIIMAPSVKINQKSPIASLINGTMGQLKFHVNDNDRFDDGEEVMKNKIVITTFNSMKGRERLCTIVTKFDESYFEYFDKSWDREAPDLPNIIYVAASRAKEQLVVIQDVEKPKFRTITEENLRKTCWIQGHDSNDKVVHRDSKEKEYGVTELIRHRHKKDIADMMNLIETQQIDPVSEVLNTNTRVQFDGYAEDIKQFYGILIPLLAEYRSKGQLRWKCRTPDEIKNKRVIIPTKLIDRYNDLIMKQERTMKEWMELCVLEESFESGHIFCWDQISDYEWVDETFINKQVDRIMNLIRNDSGDFEVQCGINLPEIKLRVLGAIDFLVADDEKSHLIREFKCALTINEDHYLQVGAYIAMYYIATDEMLEGEIYNTRTNQKIRVTLKDPLKYIKLLIKHKCAHMMPNDQQHKQIKQQEQFEKEKEEKKKEEKKKQTRKKEETEELGMKRLILE